MWKTRHKISVDIRSIFLPCKVVVNDADAAAAAADAGVRCRLRRRLVVVCSAGDDLHISVNMRGGPEKWQVTGWLQIIDVQKQHEGDYTCIAQNEHGVDRATARVNVVDRYEGL